MPEATGIRALAALPRELHFDAVVPVGAQGFVFAADDEGGLHALRGGLADELGNDRRGRRRALEVVDVGALLQFASAE